MIIAAWAQTSDTARLSCPPLKDEVLQEILQPTAWVRADWNAETSRWDLDCKQMDSIANMPMPGNALGNAGMYGNALPQNAAVRASNANVANSVARPASRRRPRP